MIYLILTTVSSTILGQQTANKDTWNSPCSYQIRLEYTDSFLLLVKKQISPRPLKAYRAWTLYQDCYYLGTQWQITAKFKKGDAERGGSWGGLFPTVQMSPHPWVALALWLNQQGGGWLPLPGAVGLLAKATGICHVSNIPCQATKWWFCCQGGNKVVLEEQGWCTASVWRQRLSKDNLAARQVRITGCR